MKPLEDAGIVARIVARQFPQLAPVRGRYFGAGMDNTAFEVNEKWVFRFPIRPEVEATLAAERALLPAVEPQLELAIPRFEFDGQPDEDFPLRFAGYEKVPGVLGTEMDQTRIDFDVVAAQLGRFLTVLHSFPVKEAERLGAVTHRLETYFEQVRAEATASLDVVERIAPELSVDRLRRYLRELDPLPPPPWPLTLTHHDLAAEHVLIAPDGSRATGVIDWGDVGIVDPTVDFVGLHAWRGEELVRAVLSHYDGPVDARVLERVRPWSTFRAIQDIRFGADNGLPDVVRLAVAALNG